LQRRNVIRVALAYLAVSWVIIEIAGVLFPVLGIPDWGARLLAIFFALGFIPALVLAWVYELTPGGLVRDTPVARSSARRLDIFIIFLVLGALAIVAADLLWVDSVGERQGLSPVAAREAPVRIPDSPPNSVAVLPFVNMSDDAANEYFSDGISEELLNLLAHVPELSVPSRSSSFRYKGRETRISDVAGALNVRYVLEGSVRKAGERVRITAQLIDAHTDAQMWSETYDRTLDDIFAIQDEIAQAVVGQLRVTLLGEVPKSEEIDPRAYAAYLQARYLNAQGTAEAFESAIDLYRAALAIAPGYARALRGLAVVYMNQANKGLRPRQESYDLAAQAIEQALVINPDYAMAHATRGVLAMTHDGDMAQAAPHFQYALSLDPDNLVLLSYSSSLLLRLGRLEETIALREYDVAHDPLDPIGHNNLAFAYLKAERPDDALAAVHTLMMLAPEYSGAKYKLGAALMLKGDNEAALEAIAGESSEVWRLIGLAQVYWALGRAGDSDEALVTLEDRHEEGWAYHIAMLRAYRGETGQAFDWLREAVDHKATSLTYIVVEPLFKTLHDDPRWLPFLESIGMSPAQLDAIEFNVSLPD
ncbi:MAG: tetratricopeptide repeat protein, partial [Lysobacterales bacterium]